MVDKGRTDKIKGKAKEMAGKATSDHEQELEGKLEQARGEAKRYGETLRSAPRRRCARTSGIAAEPFGEGEPFDTSCGVAWGFRHGRAPPSVRSGVPAAGPTVAGRCPRGWPAWSVRAGRTGSWPSRG